MCEMTLLPILCPFDPPGIYPTLTPHIGCRVGYRVQQIRTQEDRWIAEAL
jgi:hypothetical protein